MSQSRHSISTSCDECQFRIHEEEPETNDIDTQLPHISIATDKPEFTRKISTSSQPSTPLQRLQQEQKQPSPMLSPTSSSDLDIPSVTSPFTSSDYQLLTSLSKNTHLSSSDADALDAKLDRLTSYMSSCGTPTEWTTLLLSHHAQLIHILAHLIIHHPNVTHQHWHTIWLVTTIAPSEIGEVLMNIDGFVLAVAKDIAAQERRILLPRLRLLDLIITRVPSEKLAPVLTPYLESLITSLLPCLSLSSPLIFSIATADMLHLSSLSRHHSLFLPLFHSYLTTLQSQTDTPVLSLLSQEILLIVNKGRIIDEMEDDEAEEPERAEDLSLLSCTLSFIEHVFRSRDDVIFYTNDIYVLLDILLRRIEDAYIDQHITLDYLLCLASVLTWPTYGDTLYKHSSFIHTLTQLGRIASDAVTRGTGNVDEMELYASIAELCQQIRNQLERWKQGK